MNRRGFISLLAGAAGAAALPIWRTPKPVIVLPPRDFTTQAMRYRAYFTSNDAWFIKTDIPQPFLAMTDNGLIELDEAAINNLLTRIREMGDDQTRRFLRPTRFAV